MLRLRQNGAVNLLRHVWAMNYAIARAYDKYAPVPGNLQWRIARMCATSPVCAAVCDMPNQVFQPASAHSFDERKGVFVAA